MHGTESAHTRGTFEPVTRRPFPRVRIAARHPGTSPFAVAAWFAMVAALGVLGEGHAEAQPTTVGSLDAELAELVRTSGLEGRVGIHVRELSVQRAESEGRSDLRVALGEGASN